MMRFAVYKHPVFGDSDLSYSFETIVEGPSIGAVLAGPLWALAKGLWGWSGFLFLTLGAIFGMNLFRSFVPAFVADSFDVLRLIFWGVYIVSTGFLTIAGSGILKLKYDAEG